MVAVSCWARASSTCIRAGRMTEQKSPETMALRFEAPLITEASRYLLDVAKMKTGDSALDLTQSDLCQKPKERGSTSFWSMSVISQVNPVTEALSNMYLDMYMYCVTHAGCWPVRAPQNCAYIAGRWPMEPAEGHLIITRT